MPKVTQQVSDGAGFDLLSEAHALNHQTTQHTREATERPKKLSQHICASVLRPLCSVKSGGSKWPFLSEMNQTRPQLGAVEGKGADSELVVTWTVAWPALWEGLLMNLGT